VFHGVSQCLKTPASWSSSKGSTQKLLSSHRNIADLGHPSPHSSQSSQNLLLLEIMNTECSTTSKVAGTAPPSYNFASSATASVNDDITTAKPPGNLDVGTPGVSVLIRNEEVRKPCVPPSFNTIVDWDGPDDLESPRNWSVTKKVTFVCVTSGMLQAVCFGSSVIAPAQKIIAAEFDVSLTIAQLTVALWILGCFAGPLFSGPLSEMYGHLVPLAVGVSGMAILQIPIAITSNIQTVLICRFLSGAFGSGAFAIVPGMYFELYEPTPRGVALAVATISFNLGAVVGAIAGAYITYEIHWRWTAWITLIFIGFFLIVSIFTIQDSSGRSILRSKAKRLRFETGNGALHSRSEDSHTDFRDITFKYFTKPLRMFRTEPILVVMTLYLTLVYGTLYLSYEAFPIVYQRRGWSPIASSLPFLAVTLGIITAFIVCSVFFLTWYKKHAITDQGSPNPELRLPPMIVGAAMLPLALLWFGWSENVHWVSQILANYFISLSLVLIFSCGIVYLVDLYQVHATSAISIHIVVRSLVAASFPLWSTPMFSRLGVSWSLTLLALMSLILVPVPILLYIYGQKIRNCSRFSY
jgi:DHA1 family multidrug resistance protein-like MFS transporter